MQFSSWLRDLPSVIPVSRPPQRRKRRQGRGRSHSRPRLELLEDRTLPSITLSAAQTPALASIRDVSIPTQGGAPDYITESPDGNVWFTEGTTGNIGRITPDGTVTEFPVSSNTGDRAIIADAQGNLWFSDAASGATGVPPPNPQLVEMTSAGVIVQDIALPPGTSPNLAVDSRGNIWFTTYWTNQVGVVTPYGAVSTFTVPFDAANILATPAGDLWFDSSSHLGAINDLGHITPVFGSGGQVTSVTCDIYAIPNAGLLRGLAIGPQGTLWTCDESIGGIYEIGTAPGAVGQVLSRYSVGSYSRPYSLAFGPDGALWFTQNNGGELGRLAADGLITEYATASGSSPNVLTTGPDGNIWFTEFDPNKVGAFVFSPTADVVADPGVAQAFNLGSFTDPSGAGPWTVQVNWGDQTTPTTFTLNSTGAIGSQTHTYASQGAYTVTETVTDGGNASAAAQFHVVVGPVVVNTSDFGLGSLRQAISEVNTIPSLTANGPARITFDIPTSDPGYNPSTGAFTIQPHSPLPGVTAPVFIDGYSQPGASPNTLGVGDNAILPITIEGSVSDNFGDVGFGLELDAGHSTVRGLTLQNAWFFALLAYGPDNLIQGNIVITTASPFGYSGVGVGLGGSTSGFGYGTMSGTILGGTSPPDRNIISGYGSEVTIMNETTPGAPGAIVEGNYIGTNAAGTAAAQPAGWDGIEIASDNNTIADNLISGNAGNAIDFEDYLDGPAGFTLTGNVIQGNLIGTDVSGTQPVPNGAGIVFAGMAGSQGNSWPPDPSSNTVIGGTTPGTDNTIAFNSGPGVWVPGDSTITPYPYVPHPTSTPYSTGVRIEGNSIHDNTGLGIDLGDTPSGNGGYPVGNYNWVVPNGVNANAANDAANHVGGNDLMNSPILASASSSATSTSISGSFDGGTANGQPFLPNTAITLDFYANAAEDPSGYGQGQTYLGSTTVTTDANGNVTFAVDLAAGNLAGQWISATATDPNGDTSEFSRDVQATTAPSQTFAQYLQANLPQSSTTANAMTIQASSSTQPSTVIQAINGLTNVSQPVTIVLDLGGGTWSSGGVAANPPPNVTFVVENGTLDPSYPALIVSGGQVSILNCTLTTTGDAPTLLVTGGSVTLRNDVVQESTGFTDAAIAVTGGTLDLGTASSPGGNTININGTGQLIQNTTPNAIVATGTTFEAGGTVLPAPVLSFATLATSAASTIPGQPVTFTVTVRPNDSGSGTPTGSVDFVDTTANVDLGTVALSGGVASLTTSALGLGTHVIRASYGGDSTFLPSLDSLVQTVTQSIYVLNPTAAGAVSLAGTSSIDIPGTLIVDSGSPTALSIRGSAQVTAAAIQVVGGYSQSGSAIFSTPPQTGVAAVADPLAALNGPSTAGLVNYGAASFKNGAHTLNPGIYSQISASGSASLTLNPGVYVIEGGGFTVTGSASVSGTGVTLYNTGSNYPNNGGSFGGITLGGSGTFSLTAPTSGPYAGVVLFQARANTRAIALGGSAAAGLTGTVYAPAALLYLSGSASIQGALVVNALSLAGSAASTQSADASDVSAGSTAGQLLAGDLYVYISDPNGLFTSDELARIQDAVTAVDAVVEPYGVSVAETTDSSSANVIVDAGSTSAAGGFTDGVLGCYSPSGEITLIVGWNWYAGSDPTQIGATQYDFQTTVTHELGHALGLGESSDPTSAMYGTLTTGTTIRSLTTADLNIPYADAGADAQRAAVTTSPVPLVDGSHPSRESVPPNASPTASARELVSTIVFSPGTPGAIGKLAMLAPAGQGQAPPTTTGPGAGSRFEAGQPIRLLPDGVPEALGSRPPAERLPGGPNDGRRVSRNDRPLLSATGDHSLEEPSLDWTPECGMPETSLVNEDRSILSAPARVLGMDETVLGLALVLAGIPEGARDAGQRRIRCTGAKATG